MQKITEVCDALGITIAGIIDKDYWGNTESICGVPVIGSEDEFTDPVKLQGYKESYNFFCATNWIPTSDSISVRNRDKRHYLLNIIETHNLNCVSLIDPWARVSKYTQIGRGVFIDCFATIESGSSVGDFTTIYSYCNIGHDTTIGKNCVLQRNVKLASEQIVEHDVYLGSGAHMLKPNVVIGHNTFVQEMVYVARGTLPNEVVSFTGKNTRRVERPYNSQVVDE